MLIKIIYDMQDDNWNDVGEKHCMFSFLNFKKQFFIENLIRAKLNYYLCSVVILEHARLLPVKYTT